MNCRPVDDFCYQKPILCHVPSDQNGVRMCVTYRCEVTISENEWAE